MPVIGAKPVPLGKLIAIQGRLGSLKVDDWHASGAYSDRPLISLTPSPGLCRSSSGSVRVVIAGSLARYVIHCGVADFCHPSHRRSFRSANTLRYPYLRYSPSKVGEPLDPAYPDGYHGSYLPKVKNAETLRVIHYLTFGALVNLGILPPCM